MKLNNSLSFHQRQLNPRLVINLELYDYPWDLVFNKHQQEMVVSIEYDIVFIEKNNFTSLNRLKNPKKVRNYFPNLLGLCFQPYTQHLLVCDQYNRHIQISNYDNLTETYQPLYNIKPNNQEEFNGPHGVGCDPAGRILVTDTFNNKIKIFDPSGRYLSFFGTFGQTTKDFFFPHNLCFLSPFLSSSCHLLVTDNGNNRLSLWDSPCGEKRHIFNIPVSNDPRGICVDLNNYVYISCGAFDDDYNQRVVEIREPRKNFLLLQTLSIVRDDGSDKPNQFIGLCVDDENLLMAADYENHQIKFFN